MPCPLSTTLLFVTKWGAEGAGQVPWHRKCPSQPARRMQWGPPLLGSPFRAEKLLQGDGLDMRSIPPGLAAPVQVEVLAGCVELCL